MARAWLSLRLSKLEFISWAFLIPSFSPDYLYIYEIYPQSEKPLLTEIGQFHWDSYEDKFYLLPDTLIRRVFNEDATERGMVFSIVNYRTNYSTCFSADIDMTKFNFGIDNENNFEVYLFCFKTFEVSF